MLLDTHVALWAIADSPDLSAKARTLIADPASIVHVSLASLWEIAIKHAQKRERPGAIRISARDALGYFDRAGFQLLGLSAMHVMALEGLPPLHADPFDRILVAQAASEPLQLVTHDAKLVAYGAMILPV